MITCHYSTSYGKCLLLFLWQFLFSFKYYLNAHISAHPLTDMVLLSGRAFTNTIDNLNMIIAEVAASTNQQRQGPQERFQERPQERFQERPQERFQERPQERFQERPQERFQERPEGRFQPQEYQRPQEDQRPQEPADTVRPPPPPFQRLPIHIPINLMGGFQVPSQEVQQDVSIKIK